MEGSELSIIRPGRLLAAAARKRPLSYVARAVRRSRQIELVGSPVVSVVVPIYNVEQFLERCLNSLKAQTYGQLEVVMVNDGATDSSREIALRYAEEDLRFRLIDQTNGGLGAARNTGCSAATGKYLTLLDSDDWLPPHAIAELVESLEKTGSDIAIGAIVRILADGRRRKAKWVQRIHARPHLKVRAEDAPEVLRNFYSVAKLYRLDFWRRHDFRFREGVLFEDQPLVTETFCKANTIDILDREVYYWCVRGDNSSLSDDIYSVEDIRARSEAVQLTWRTITKNASQPLVDGWLMTHFEDHFPHYVVRCAGKSTEQFRAVVDMIEPFQPEIERLAPTISVHARVLMDLALAGDEAATEKFVEEGGFHSARFPVRSIDGTDYGLLPGYPDGYGLLSREHYRVGANDYDCRVTLSDMRWTNGSMLTLKGWASMTFVDGETEGLELKLELCTDRSAEPIPTTTRAADLDLHNLTNNAEGYEQAAIAFEAAIDFREAPQRYRKSDRIDFVATVRHGDIERRARVTSCMFGTRARYAPGSLVCPGKSVRIGRANDQLFFGIETHYAELTDARVAGGIEVEIALHDEKLQSLTPSHVELRLANEPVAVGRLCGDSGERLSFVVERDTFSTPAGVLLPLAGESLAAYVVFAGGVARRLYGTALTVTDVIERSGRIVQLDNRGRVSIRPSAALDPQLSGFSVGADGTLECQLSSRNGSDAAIELVLARSQAASPTGHAVFDVNGRCTVRVPPLNSIALGWGPVRDLPLGVYRLQAQLIDNSGMVRTSSVQASPSIENKLGFYCVQGQSGRSVRLLGDRRGQVAVEIQAGVCYRDRSGRGRGKLRRDYEQTVLARLKHAILFRNYWGSDASDSALSLAQLLSKEHPDLEQIWSVDDASRWTPPGARRVLEGSADFYEAINTSRLVMLSVYQPTWFHKNPGQKIIQTHHGYPFKLMGRSMWTREKKPRYIVADYERRARDWDFLVSPASYASPLLMNEFGLADDPGDCQLLEIGYPRNDIFLQPAGGERRASLRQRLGISEGQKVVFYAPTFRDYWSAAAGSPMANFFDPEEAAAELGDEYVILVRGHGYNRSGAVLRGRRVIDMSRYPDPADLCLASDIAVLDYSSLRFDYALLDKPMVFMTPDKDRYFAARPSYMEYDETAPGPQVDTIQQCIETIRLLTHSAEDPWATARAEFRASYMDLEDGHATERLLRHTESLTSLQSRDA